MSPVETSGQLPGSSVNRDQVVLVTSVEPDTLNPLFSGPGGSLPPSRLIEPLLFTTDVQLDRAGKFFPQGVEYLPSLKDGTWRVDGEQMTLLWRLKRRLWHDGRPVTCGDYVFAYNVTRTKQAPPISFGYEEAGRRIAHLTCPQGANGKEVAVTWNARTTRARETIIGGPPVPRHLLERAFRANPSALNKVPYGTEPKATVGDGAYRLTEWRLEQSITLDAVNDHSIFGTPRIKRIVFRRFPRGTLPGAPVLDLLLTGQIDIFPGVALSLLSALKQQTRGRIKVLAHPTLQWEHIDFNLDNPLLQDVRVRRAIAHAVNRTQIVQQVWQGYAGVSHTYLPPGHPGYAADVQQYPYDPARARVLLHEAGFVPGPDGILRNARGQRLVLELSTTAATIREQIEQIIQQQLREVGIDIAIVNYPLRVFFGGIVDHRKFAGLALYAWLFRPSSDCDELYTSDGIPSESNGWKGDNIPGYRNAEMDKVCKAAARELDDSRKSQLLKQSARIFSRDLPALPLFVQFRIAAVRPGLENYTPTRDPPETWNAHTWYWR